MKKDSIIEKFRKKRTVYLKPLGKLLIRARIKADYLTYISLLFALLSVYYLFDNHLLFIIFGLLHLFFDGIDGVIARLTRTTIFGAYLDKIVDASFVILLLLKSAIRFNDFIIITALIVYSSINIVYFLSKMKSPITFSRTMILIFYIFNFYFMGYFALGILSLYGLWEQIKSYVLKR